MTDPNLAEQAEREIAAESKLKIRKVSYDMIEIDEGRLPLHLCSQSTRTWKLWDGWVRDRCSLLKLRASHSWIKITDDPQTLPERGHFYLIVFFNRHIGMAWYGKNDWETVTRFTELRGMVTHWQPLPPPPES